MNDFDMFHHPQLGWIELDKAEADSIGIELYINQLHTMGFDSAMAKSGRPKKLVDVLAEFPFVDEDLMVYVSLMKDGWKRLQMSHAEDLGCSFFLNSKVGRVSPLFKTFGNAKCVFDFNGFTWYFGSKKLLYGAPLPF